MLTATYMMGAMIESRDETNIFSPSLLFLRTDALETALTSSSIYSFWIQLKSTHLYAVSFSPVLPAHLSMATGCTLLKVKALFYFYSLLFFRCRSIARMADAFDFILFSFSLSRREFLFLLGFSWVVCMHFLNSLHVFLSLTSCVVLCDFYCSGRLRHHSHDLLLLFRNMRSVWMTKTALFCRHYVCAFSFGMEGATSRDIFCFSSFNTIAKYDNELCDATLACKMAKWEAIQKPTFFAIDVFLSFFVGRAASASCKLHRKWRVS